MSADNYIGVLKTEDGKYGLIPYGSMSMLDEDCMYRGTIEGSYLDDRAEALVAAHDMLKKQSIVEYGVIELDPVPEYACGKCFVCINERGIVADDVTRCTKCTRPIHAGEWYTVTSTGTYHRSCEPMPKGL